MPSIHFTTRYRVILLHIGAWLAYISFATLRNVTSSPAYEVDVLGILMTYLPSICLFYLNVYFFARFLITKQYITFFFVEVLLFVAYFYVGYAMASYVTPVLNGEARNDSLPISTFFIMTLWLYFVYSSFAFGYFFARHAVQKEKELRLTERKQLHAEQEKLQVEKEKLKAEYAFLRAQINPHFLHNTLNFFYAKSIPLSNELSEAILTLCEIMRYSLEGGDSGDGFVSLNKEVEHLKNVIKINQIRFSNRLQVKLDVTGNINNIRVIPLVLVTLVENAFKHGELGDVQHPLSFQLTVDEEKRQVFFSSSNKKKKGPKELSHGIGMDNIIKRLKGAYKEDFMLEIHEDHMSYAVELRMSFGPDVLMGEPEYHFSTLLAL